MSNNEEVVLAAVQQHGLALKYVRGADGDLDDCGDPDYYASGEMKNDQTQLKGNVIKNNGKY